ncbi:MAG TPA: hypothetical protein VFW73_01690 [Lacipirellulaceae bacterium]|nr:hypothetical protein [Lacipirellulaceae bacterium]
MKRVEMEADQMPGQDSFLDVITNIVGILILLVLVVGLRSSRAVHDAPNLRQADAARDQEKLRQACNHATSTALNVRDLVRRVTDAHGESEFREAERLWLGTNVAQAEQEIAQRRAMLSSDQQRDFDLKQKLNEAQTKLDELTREQIALMSQDAPTEQIECEPTALAKAVTGKEVHLLLSDDHVAIVPFDELLDAMKEDVGKNLWRLKEQDQMERTIGPIGGFRLKYCFVKEDVMRSSSAGTYMLGNVSRFSHCYFLPVTTPIGEPAAEALTPKSELFRHLNELRPDATTITIWTYPGNYDRLRQLKRVIRAAGFQIAVRPLPAGMPLGASRNGSQSLSE